MTLATLECADAADSCEHSLGLARQRSITTNPNVIEKGGRTRQQLGERARGAFSHNIHRIWTESANQNKLISLELQVCLYLLATRGCRAVDEG